MNVAQIIEIAKSLLIGLAVAGMIGIALSLLYRDNRLLFRCLLLALFCHIGVFGGIWLTGFIVARAQAQNQFAQLTASIEKPPPPPPPPPDKKEEVHPLDKPLGKINGDRNVTKIKKGHTLDPKANPGATGKKTFGNRNVIASPSDSSSADVQYNPDARSNEYLGPGDSLDRNDLNNIGKPGGAGQDWGDPNGDDKGGVPVGFADGKRGGKVYFIRLKHGSGAWYAYDSGTKRMLRYLNKEQGFPCETETWPMTTDELKKKYMAKGAFPTFLYLYCDDTFALSSGDVNVLREYMDHGGFLFCDSRTDPSIRDRVAHELDKILPGMRLSPISFANPINSFLFVLPTFATGENFTKDARNYGISRNGRLVVFYTMGNFSHMYEGHDANEFPFVTGTYQMGANVMLYAITKGDASGISKKKGASTAVSVQALEQLGFLESSGSSNKVTTPGGPPPESVKIKRTPAPGSTTSPDAPPPDPDEIKVIEDK